MKRFASDRVAGLMERLGLEDDVAIESRLVSQDDRERPDAGSRATTSTSASASSSSTT